MGVGVLVGEKDRETEAETVGDTEFDGVIEGVIVLLGVGLTEVVMDGLRVPLIDLVAVLVTETERVGEKEIEGVTEGLVDGVPVGEGVGDGKIEAIKCPATASELVFKTEMAAPLVLIAIFFKKFLLLKFPISFLVYHKQSSLWS